MLQFSGASFGSLAARAARDQNGLSPGPSTVDGSEIPDSQMYKTL